MLSISNETTRTLLIRMGELCKAYREPYDKTDKEDAEYNALLEAALQICGELLAESSR